MAWKEEYTQRMFSSDDDLDESLSSRRSLERADHGKKEKSEQKKHVREKKELLKLKTDMLLKRAKASPLAKDDKKTFGPQTFEEKSAKQYESVMDQKARPEDAVGKEEENEQREKEARQEQQSEMG